MTITTREQLDALPVGGRIVVKQGYTLRKVGPVQWRDETNGEDNDTGEIMGDYTDGDPWLPATEFERDTTGWQAEVCTNTDTDCTVHDFPPEGTRVRVIDDEHTRNVGDDSGHEFVAKAGETGIVIGYMVEWHHVHVELDRNDMEHGADEDERDREVWLDPDNLTNDGEPPRKHYIRHEDIKHPANGVAYFGPFAKAEMTDRLNDALGNLMADGSDLDEVILTDAEAAAIEHINSREDWMNELKRIEGQR